MDSITARVWESSQFRGNAFLLLQLIAHSIAAGNLCPKLDHLGARIKVSRRQVERLEAMLIDSQELQKIEGAGRGRGNRYDIPMIRDLLSQEVRSQFEAFDARRLADALGEDPTKAAGFCEVPTHSTGEENPTEAAGKPETPTKAAGIVAPTELTGLLEDPTEAAGNLPERATDAAGFGSGDAESPTDSAGLGALAPPPVPPLYPPRS